MSNSKIKINVSLIWVIIKILVTALILKIHILTDYSIYSTGYDDVLDGIWSYVCAVSICFIDVCRWTCESLLCCIYLLYVCL